VTDDRRSTVAEAALTTVAFLQEIERGLCERRPHLKVVSRDKEDTPRH
jgi:hypothetical protein